VAVPLLTWMFLIVEKCQTENKQLLIRNPLILDSVLIGLISFLTT